MVDEVFKRGPGRPRKDPSLPSEHIGQIDAGYTRNEELARRTDDLAEQIDTAAADPDGLEAIDENKLRHIDNEIAQHIGRSGHITISNRQDAYEYSFVPHAQEFSGNARSAVRNMHATMQEAGWHYVKEDMPEARELIGNDCTSGTSLRGWGDCVLMRIDKDRLAQQGERIARKQAASYAQEEQVQVLASRYGVHIDVLNGRLQDGASRTAQQVWGREGPLVVPVRSNFGDQVLRDGTIPGFHAGPRR